MLGTAALRQSFDFTVAIVNTPGSRSRSGASRRNRNICVRSIVSSRNVERQAPMSAQPRRKRNPQPTRTRRPAKRDKRADRSARERALDRALEDTFPASDPVAASEPAPDADRD